MSSIGLDSQVETLFDKLRLCNTILEAYGRQILEAALGIDMKAQESNYNYNKLKGFPFLGDVSYSLRSKCPRTLVGLRGLQGLRSKLGRR